MNILYGKMLLASGLRDLILWKLSHEDDEEKYVLVDCYQNGRELGYTITVAGNVISKSVTISECRNSDSIMVYKDNVAMQGLSEPSYQEANCFGADDFSKVVEFCVKYLK